MGVRGLKSFIENNDGLFNHEYQLADTHLVIDASNLVCVLIQLSQKHERRDLFGGDMVQFGKYLRKFFINLKSCNIVPILVFDGAQTYEQNKSKTAEKHRRALERFQRVVSISKTGFGDFILPAAATNVFRSVSVDMNIKMVQCMFEADCEIARIAKEYQSPVLSNDSDFFLMDLPYGLITIDFFKHERVLQFDGQKFLECSLYNRLNFHVYLPNLVVSNLPLLGVLAGNDFVSERAFEKICSRMSAYRTTARGSRDFRKNTSKQHDKIVKILYFLCDKTLDESVNQICSQVAKNERGKLKQIIQGSCLVYKVPRRDNFTAELATLYWPSYLSTHQSQMMNMDQLHRSFSDFISNLENWLRMAMEHSVLSYRCLELAHRNTIFIICHMDDPQLLSAHNCQIRPMRVMSALLRLSPKDTKPIVVYDRVGHSYDKRLVRPLRKLNDYVCISDCKLSDLFSMSIKRRCDILMATFHCSLDFFEDQLHQYYDWFVLDQADEFLMVKLLMDYIDFESDARLWKQFRQATLLCMLHYSRKDSTTRSASDDIDEFTQNLAKLIKNRHYDKMPTLSRKRKYNIRLMHQIVQLNSAIITFNGMNAFLGDVMVRIRTETWLNSCLIYNLAEAMHQRVLRFPDLPPIVYNIPR